MALLRGFDPSQHSTQAGNQWQRATRNCFSTTRRQTDGRTRRKRPWPASRRSRSVCGKAGRNREREKFGEEKRGIGDVKLKSTKAENSRGKFTGSRGRGSYSSPRARRESTQLSPASPSVCLSVSSFCFLPLHEVDVDLIIIHMPRAIQLKLPMLLRIR